MEFVIAKINKTNTISVMHQSILHTFGDLHIISITTNIIERCVENIFMAVSAAYIYNVALGLYIFVGF